MEGKNCYFKTKIQKAFLWKSSALKIKHETLRNNYKAGGLKDVHIPN